MQLANGETTTRTTEYETTLDDAEARQVLAMAAQSFIATIEFHKKDFGDPKSHEEAIQETLQIYECRRNCVAGLHR